MALYHKTTCNLSKILDRLACPKCHEELILQNNYLICNCCTNSYSITNGIADLRLNSSHNKKELIEWLEHWSTSNQENLSQRFFSFYRKAVFARTVRHFTNKYFPLNGIFVEAGSGTSETSIRINKRQDARTLVAVDIALPILERCSSIMDVKLCADIFSLPFLDNSIDGIWNVGVMEHFTYEQIDQIMHEFHRVLKSGGLLILLWPGTNSIPQKILHLIEKVINTKHDRQDFRFHPPEISQLRSTHECKDVLNRNGFNALHIDFGFWSLMAFKTLIGGKK